MANKHEHSPPLNHPPEQETILFLTQEATHVHLKCFTMQHHGSWEDRPNNTEEINLNLRGRLCHIIQTLL